jgi:AraC-like DNA-binding protein
MGVQELAVVGLVGSGVGAALGVPLVWPRRQRRADPGVLGTALVLMATIGALISARLAGLVPASAAVEHVINVLGLAAFPLAVVYVRQATGRPRAFTALLAIPALAYLAAVAVRAGLMLDTRIPFAWLLPAVLGFTAAAAVAVWRAGTRPATVPVPASWVVGFLALVNVAQVARMDFGHVPVMRAVVPLTFAAGFAAMVARLSWRSLTTPVLPAPGAGNQAPLLPRYERSALDDATARALLCRIEQALDRERLFARPELTLAQLAEAAAATPHQVSEALNRFAGTTFRDLVNGRRVRDVKAQLADPASDRYTIEGIGASAGFRSRSALYAAFHRAEGMTPTACRRASRKTVAPA